MSAPGAPEKPAAARGAAPWVARELWGGVTLVVIWLAVLFVGIWGGSIETTSAGGGSSSVPVVVVVALAALLATVSVGRWAFRRPAGEDDLRRAIEEERRGREQLLAVLEDMRAKLPST